MARSRRLFTAMRLVFAMSVMVLFLAFTVEVHAQRHVSEGSVPPTWDRTLPANDGEADGCNSSRFTCVLPDATFHNGAAVRDNETGLVWERASGETDGVPGVTLADRVVWGFATLECVQNRTVGGRKGWRLPSVHELASLVDPGNPGGDPKLPVGHPFDLGAGQSSNYWSATTIADDPTSAWDVGIDNGNLGISNKAVTLFVWCVRGGGPLSEY